MLSWSDWRDVSYNGLDLLICIISMTPAATNSRLDVVAMVAARQFSLLASGWHDQCAVRLAPQAAGEGAAATTPVLESENVRNVTGRPFSRFFLGRTSTANWP